MENAVFTVAASLRDDNMPDLPLLFFPQPVDADRTNLGGGGTSIHKPSASAQRTRLNRKFEQISSSFVQGQTNEHGLTPEQVIVFETIGERVEGLARAAEHVPGLEWLAEMDFDDLAPEHGFQVADDATKELPLRIYAVMSNQQAMNRLVGLWDNWCANPTERAERNFGPFKNLFINLRDVRRWGVEDRIRTTGLLDYLGERLEGNEDIIQFEVELWCRRDEQSRNDAYENLRMLVADQGGTCVRQSIVVEIGYHGVLVRMPASAVRETVEGILSQTYGQLVRCDDVMFFRPFGQAAFDAVSLELEDSDGDLPNLPDAEGNPIVALLDGLPVENHAALSDRLVLDDEDGLAQQYAAEHRQHGTAMASLILYGDLNESGAPISTPVYVRPILVPEQDFANRVSEVTPRDELLVDLIHRSVRRMFEGATAAAPTVKVINLSVANRFQPFDRETSPVARLLDWLSWKYRVLFLVSVGNHTDEIQLDTTCAEWSERGADELAAESLKALRRDQRLRRPFAPSESINAITVGALHADAAPSFVQGRRADLFNSRRLPSPLGTFSSGFRRSIKPEVFFPGGRQLFHQPIGGNTDPAVFTVSEGSQPPGQKVAAPGMQPLELTRTVHCRGTSNATALATRLGAQIYERLLELQSEPGGDDLTDEYMAVVLKCLLVHGATWSDNGVFLDSVFRELAEAEFGTQNAWRELDRIKNSFLGYGEVQAERALFSNDDRVTVVGWATIREDQGHQFQLPLPPALSASNVVRRVTGTLAWLTPINPQHRNYRQAYLWFTFPEGDLGVSRLEVDADSSRRGTVEHRVFEGNRVIAMGEDDILEFTVSCKSDAGRLRDEVPYAFAVTLEVAEPLGVSIFDQVRNRVRQRIDL